jgi:hypothetical protein
MSRCTHRKITNTYGFKAERQCFLDQGHTGKHYFGRTMIEGSRVLANAVQGSPLPTNAVVKRCEELDMSRPEYPGMPRRRCTLPMHHEGHHRWWSATKSKTPEEFAAKHAAYPPKNNHDPRKRLERCEFPTEEGPCQLPRDHNSPHSINEHAKPKRPRCKTTGVYKEETLFVEIQCSRPKDHKGRCRFPGSRANSLASLRKRLRISEGLWLYWVNNDITANDDLWAEFTNAVHAMLRGQPVPEKFIKEG